jgi:hypothetical protein
MAETDLLQHTSKRVEIRTRSYFHAYSVNKINVWREQPTAHEPRGVHSTSHMLYSSSL